MIVGHGTDSIRQAARELMVESLKEEDTDRMVSDLLDQDADEATLAKARPARTVAAGFYDFARYLMWVRGMLDAGVELELLADEAEGLGALQIARNEFERDHPACPQCRIRQYNSTPMFCRNRACRMDFRKKN